MQFTTLISVVALSLMTSGVLATPVFGGSGDSPSTHFGNGGVPFSRGGGANKPTGAKPNLNARDVLEDLRLVARDNQCTDINCIVDALRAVKKGLTARDDPGCSEHDVPCLLRAFQAMQTPPAPAPAPAT